MDDFWGFLQDHEAVTTATHQNQADEFAAAMAAYTLPTFTNSVLVKAVEVAPAVQDKPKKTGKFDPHADLAYLISGKAPEVVTRKGPKGSTRKINTVKLRDEYERKFYAEVLAFMNSGKVYTEDVVKHFADHLVAQAFGKKRPAKYITKVVENIQEWLFFKNCVKPFMDSLVLTHEAVHTRKLQRASKADFPAMSAVMAMQQAKDNSKLGLASLPYITRIGTLLLVEFEVPVENMSKRLATYEKKGFILRKKGVRGGVATRIAVKPTQETISTQDKRKAADKILARFLDSEIKDALAAVYDRIVEMAHYDYKDCDLKNKVQTLIIAFNKLSKSVGDERSAERHLEEVDWQAAKEAADAEIKARIDAHFASGKTLLPTPEETPVPETPVEPAESPVEQRINSGRTIDPHLQEIMDRFALISAAPRRTTLNDSNILVDETVGAEQRAKQTRLQLLRTRK